MRETVTDQRPMPLATRLDAIEARLTAQDEAWTAWRAAAGLPAPRPDRHLAVVRGADDLDAS
ncbi:MAG TPA: hypothetical protein VNF47_13325 [Streptosporangiaceae bacterium]|nr:hypothetical protein [Streptosporangiaceae bacterium]